MKKPFTPLILVLALFISLSGFSLPKLSSYPAAPSTIYLDFDGQVVNSAVWNGGTAFTCAPATLTDAQITEIFNRVSEDYRPFEINITTDEAVFTSAPLEKRIRVIVTPTSSWYGNAGGVAYVGSFTWGDDTPAFVFSALLGNSPKMVAECCSHESGHSVGLSHQSKYDASCNLSAVYNDGVGSGEPSWAPIMGNSYNRNMSGWNNGPTPYGCTYVQDNLSIITSQNGFGYRIDDFPNDIITTKAQSIDAKNISVDGIITTTTDKDAFEFTLAKNANFHLDIKPYSVAASNAGANLDVKVQLYNSSKTLIRTYDPATTMAIVIDTILNQGDYYLIVDGDGNANTSGYGSLGSYQMRGIAGLLPIRDVALTGKSDNSKHNLNWNIISDEPIKTIVVETSTDGVNFKAVNSFSSSIKNFIYTPFEKSDMYYRLKVTSTYNQTVYSNIIVLKSVNNVSKLFTVSTLVRNDISVNAATNYQYILNDMNGKILAKGNGMQGFNKLNVGTQSKGMYILQIISNNQRQIERIIKQ